MDTSAEFAESPKTPESHAERITAITGMINDQNEYTADSDGATPKDSGDGEAVPVEAVRGDGSGHGADPVQTGDAPTGVDDDQSGEEKTDTPGDDDAITLSSLANHLGVEQSDVYELDIPIADGESVTLGQLKDEYKEYGTAKDYQAKLTGERDTFEKQVLQTRSELNAIMANIPENMRGQLIEAASGHQKQWQDDQEKAVLEAIPDWADSDKRAKDRESLVTDGAEYGFTAAEITYTQDARTLRMLNDFSKMKRELSEMRTAAKAQPGKASAPGRGTASTQSKRKLRAAIGRAKADPTMQGKASVVSQLIRNQ
jgi:hypothetical protein